MNQSDKKISFYELKWDTEFFGVKSAKAVLHKPLSLYEWRKFHSRCCRI